MTALWIKDAAGGERDFEHIGARLGLASPPNSRRPSQAGVESAAQ
jgi:hypothetical protein